MACFCLTREKEMSFALKVDLHKKCVNKRKKMSLFPKRKCPVKKFNIYKKVLTCRRISCSPINDLNEQSKSALPEIIHTRVLCTPVLIQCKFRTKSRKHFYSVCVFLQCRIRFNKELHFCKEGKLRCQCV